VLRSKVSVFVDIFRQAEPIKRQAELAAPLERREHERLLADAKAGGRRNGSMRNSGWPGRSSRSSSRPPRSRPPGWTSPAGRSGRGDRGDYFDYIPMQDGNLAVVIGDVCGHGFGPALVMAELRAYLRALLLTRTDVGEIVRLLNHALAGDNRPNSSPSSSPSSTRHPVAGVRGGRPPAGLRLRHRRRGEGPAREHRLPAGHPAGHRLPGGVAPSLQPGRWSCY